VIVSPAMVARAHGYCGVSSVCGVSSIITSVVVVRRRVLTDATSLLSTSTGMRPFGDPLLQVSGASASEGACSGTIGARGTIGFERQVQRHHERSSARYSAASVSNDPSSSQASARSKAIRASVVAPVSAHARPNQHHAHALYGVSSV
jgi:hypothetical protein